MLLEAAGSGQDKHRRRAPCWMWQKEGSRKERFWSEGRAVVVCMSPVLLRLIGLRAFSMATEAYASGSLSAAYVTCPNDKVAKDIARGLVEKKLAACVNIIPQITSIYEWKGKIEEDSEVLLMIKTRSSKVPSLTEYVRSVHPYEVCEVISVPIDQGNPPYLSWVEDAVPK
ncbi:protein CutA isoform X1 [Rana temporaria]|uniref:protein CutA isoform X1 n=2 Tax=Rana temporaria TaxID=8407 RepID=UPI001AAD6C4D|nr:protein CutA isoform X1 [Rana temporaria]